MKVKVLFLFLLFIGNAGADIISIGSVRTYDDGSAIEIPYGADYEYTVNPSMSGEFPTQYGLTDYACNYKYGGSPWNSNRVGVTLTMYFDGDDYDDLQIITYLVSTFARGIVNYNNYNYTARKWGPGNITFGAVFIIDAEIFNGQDVVIGYGVKYKGTTYGPHWGSIIQYLDECPPDPTATPTHTPTAEPASTHTPTITPTFTPTPIPVLPAPQLSGVTEISESASTKTYQCTVTYPSEFVDDVAYIRFWYRYNAGSAWSAISRSSHAAETSFTYTFGIPYFHNGHIVQLMAQAITSNSNNILSSEIGFGGMFVPIWSVPPTNTFTPTFTPTPTSTSPDGVPPTNTPTPTITRTPITPTATYTNTPVDPDATPQTPTNTPTGPTPTNTPTVPTPTPTFTSSFQSPTPLPPDITPNPTTTAAITPFTPDVLALNVVAIYDPPPGNTFLLDRIIWWHDTTIVNINSVVISMATGTDLPISSLTPLASPFPYATRQLDAIFSLEGITYTVGAVQVSGFGQSDGVTVQYVRSTATSTATPTQTPTPVNTPTNTPTHTPRPVLWRIVTNDSLKMPVVGTPLIEVDYE